MHGNLSRRLHSLVKVRRSPPIALLTLNDHFANIVRDSDTDGPLSILSCDQRENFTFHKIVTSETQNALTSLKTSTASGHDRLAGSLLSQLAVPIAPYITAIFN